MEMYVILLYALYRIQPVYHCYVNVSLNKNNKELRLNSGNDYYYYCYYYIENIDEIKTDKFILIRA